MIAEGYRKRIGCHAGFQYIQWPCSDTNGFKSLIAQVCVTTSLKLNAKLRLSSPQVITLYDRMDARDACFLFRSKDVE